MAMAQDRMPEAAEQQSFDAHIAEAAQRFGVPAAWISAVIEVESAGNPRAVSSAGAMGLMQIMPGTWSDLRRNHGFGDDLFDPRENILAGTAYLRAMYDHFGSPGFLAAYNAGPARYAEYLATGRSLPTETRNFLAVLAPIISAQQDATFADELPLRPQDWREAPPFAATPIATMDEAVTGPQSDDRDIPHGLFVPLGRSETP
ncbi:lytic transglycosylase domain-containing protein [Gymnodinialimonas phycosphaerae]|nr:lytic transglycosylase domain-containing protein [Gymnodinialimonas phycosphaerae]